MIFIRTQKLLRGKFAEAYIANAAQMLSMFATSFGIPFVIGIESYGKYAAVFAQAATVSVLAYGFYLSKIGSMQHDEFRGGAWVLNILAAAFSFALASLFLELWDAALLASIMYALLERQRMEVLVLMEGVPKYWVVLRNFELLGFLSTALALGIAWYLQVSTYFLPGGLICFNLMLSSYFLKRALTHKSIAIKASHVSSLFKSFSLSIFARAHEELFLTCMPFLIGLLIGSREAGAFRITISVVKVAFKAFPYRYEKVLSDFQQGKLDLDRVFEFTLYMNLLAVGLAVCVKVCNFLLPDLAISKSIDSWILITAGMQAFLAVFTPPLLIRQPKHYFLELAAFGAILAALYFEGHRMFQLTFVGAHVLLTIATLHFLVKLSRTEKTD